jgi:hypothetical protein
MTKIPAHVWIASVAFLTVLTIAYLYAPQIVIGFVLVTGFIIPSCALLVAIIHAVVTRRG